MRWGNGRCLQLLPVCDRVLAMELRGVLSNSDLPGHLGRVRGPSLSSDPTICTHPIYPPHKPLSPDCHCGSASDCPGACPFPSLRNASRTRSPASLMVWRHKGVPQEAGAEDWSVQPPPTTSPHPRHFTLSQPPSPPPRHGCPVPGCTLRP